MDKPICHGFGFYSSSFRNLGLFKGVYLPRLPVSVGLSCVVGSFMTWKAKYSPQIGTVEVAAATCCTVLSVLLCVVGIAPRPQWILAMILSALILSLVGASIRTLISRNDDAWRKSRDIRRALRP